MKGKKIVLRTGHFHAYHRACTLAARNKGWFRDEGLTEIDIGAMGEDDITVDGLKSGSIDFGLDVCPAYMLEENSRGEELYIIAGMLNYLPHTLIGAPGVKSIGDLKGKKIAGGGRDPYIRVLLRNEGLDPDKDVTWASLPFGSHYANLETARVGFEQGLFQACHLSAHYPRPQLFEWVRQAGYNHLAERSETHPGGWAYRTTVTTGKMLTQHPQIVKGVLKGVLRGYRWARDKKNAGQIREMYLTGEKTGEWDLPNYGWGKWDESVEIFEGMIRLCWRLTADGFISLSGLDAMIGEYIASGRLPIGFAKEQVLRLEPLQEAVRELNAKFGPEGYA